MTHVYAQAPTTDLQLLETLLQYDGRAFMLVWNDEGDGIIGVTEAQTAPSPTRRGRGRYPEPAPFSDGLLLFAYDELLASDGYVFKETGNPNFAAIYRALAEGTVAGITSASRIKTRLKPLIEARRGSRLRSHEDEDRAVGINDVL